MDELMPGTKKVIREVSLTIRLTAEDRKRLEELRIKLSPYAPVSLGKAVSAAIRIALENVK